MLSQDQINSWQPGGTAYNGAVARWGQQVAATLASAASGGDETALQNALEAAQGNVGEQDDSELDALANQLYNNPLGAPLNQLGTVAANTVASAEDAGQAVVGSLLVSPVVLLTIAAIGVGVIVYFGGFNAVKRKFI